MYSEESFLFFWLLLHSLESITKWSKFIIKSSNWRAIVRFEVKCFSEKNQRKKNRFHTANIYSDVHYVTHQKLETIFQGTTPSACAV